MKDESGTRSSTPIDELLSFSIDKVPNLYTLENNTFVFLYKEGDTIGEFECEFEDTEKPKGISITWDNQPFVELGLNYLGKIIITHPDSSQCSIKMIGEWSYDPAGVTTSAHASERIGGDCFSMQLGVTAAQVMAFKAGCPEDFIYEIQTVTLPTIMKYHERFFLHEWMGMQVLEACYRRNDCISYPEYLIDKVKQGELRLDSDNRTHTIEYLESYLNMKSGSLSIDSLGPSTAFYAKMLSTVGGFENLTEKIGSESAAVVQDKANNVNYNLSKIEAPLVRQMCQYLDEAIIQLANNEEYQQSDLVMELDTCHSSMHAKLRSQVDVYKKNIN